MTKAARERDVIDVNRRWAPLRGDRRVGFRIGTVLAPDRVTAARSARKVHSGLLFVEEERW